MKAAPAEEILNKLNVQNADKRYFNFFPHTLLITIFIKTYNFIKINCLKLLH